MNTNIKSAADRSSSRLDVRGFMGILRRYKWWLILGPLIGIGAAILLLASTPPTYTATGAVFVDPRARRIVTEEVNPAGYVIDASLVESQVSILVSDSVLRRVVEREKLVEDPDFYTEPSTGFLAELKSLIRGPRPVVDAETHAIEMLARHVRVKRPAKSYVLEVEVASSSPAKAARIANAVMQAYLDDQTAAKAEESRRANSLIDARIGELREKVRQGEQRLDDFRKANRIVVSEGGIVAEQQLGKLNIELATARSVAAEAAARLEQARAAARSGTPDLLPEAVKSGLVQKLREQYSQVARREAALSQQLKGRHPVLVDVRSQLAELEGQIDAELRRIAASAKGEADIAKAREREILAATERAKREVGTSNTAQIKMRELEQDLATSRELLGAFIARAKESLEQASLTTPEARIITPAAVPTRQSFPSPLLFLALGALGGLGAGIGRALLGDALDGSVRPEETPRTAPASLPVRATLPVLGTAKSILERTQSWFGGRIEDGHFSDILQVMSDPQTPGAARYRQAILRLTSTLRPKDGKTAIAAIVSPRSGAGASSTALAIAYSAALSGERTLLVDAASANAALSEVFAGSLDAGTVVVLDSKDDLARITTRDDRSGLSVLPIALADLRRLKATQRTRLAEGLAALAKSYDLVVIDAGPILEDDAVLTLLPLAGDVLVVAREGDTPQSDLEETAVATAAVAGAARRSLILNGHI
ncbi:MAG: exopolysaccharide transport family protein [Hyphomonas sp.]|nr:exopolysaccharide transport family protein [Hyphomonas sp.]